MLISARGRSSFYLRCGAAPASEALRNRWDRSGFYLVFYDALPAAWLLIYCLQPVGPFMRFQSAGEAVEKTFGAELHSERGCGTRRADEAPRKTWREAAQRAEENA